MGLGVNALFILTGLLFAAVCIAVADALGQLSRRRRAEDTATSRIRSAAQGYVELQGRLVTPSGEPQVTRFAKEKCVWWRYQVQVRRVNQECGGPAQVHWLTKPTDGRPFKSHFGHEPELVRRSWLSARAFPWVIAAFLASATLFVWLAWGR